MIMCCNVAKSLDFLQTFFGILAQSYTTISAYFVHQVLKFEKVSICMFYLHDPTALKIKFHNQCLNETAEN